jgi:DNA-binding NarL/FixJ family response regulator
MLGMELTAARWAGHARIVAGLRQRLGEPAFATAWMAGRGLSAAQAVEDVLTSAGAMSVAGPQRVARSGPLTSDSESDLSQRERQVLTLLIDGRSDREIAAALFISQRTASTHVGSILRKLNASTRAEAAVRAVRDGLV